MGFSYPKEKAARAAVAISQFSVISFQLSGHSGKGLLHSQVNYAPAGNNYLQSGSENLLF